MPNNQVVHAWYCCPGDTETACGQPADGSVRVIARFVASGVEAFQHGVTCVPCANEVDRGRLSK